ncbi:MAG: RNA polymerase sigma-54 factor [Acidobacteria bacterium]|nr:MAG: RNA polymerase sigma-54 factor [Acidobacteriota bacterium]
MALEQKLNLRLSQRLVMTPSLQQAIKLLQLSRLELSETLTEEILENPMLDVDGPIDENEGGDKDRVSEPEVGSDDRSLAVEADPAVVSEVVEDQPKDDPTDAYEQIDVEAFFSDYLADSRPEGPSMAGRDPEIGNSLENTLSESPGLYEHLEWQIHMMDCPIDLLPVCEFLLGNLDEDGFLRASDDEIIQGTGATPVQLANTLSIIQSLDPAGVGTRSLQPCFLIQLDRLQGEIEDDDCDGGELLALARVLTEDHWDDLLHQRWSSIAGVFECTVPELKPVLEIINRLETRPGRRFQQSRNAFIEPDVTLKKVNGDYVITLNDDGMPKLRLNHRYSRMLEGSTLDPKVSAYLKERMRSAMWLMKSIDQRQRTIYKVANSIVSFQKGFLDDGIEYLKPMVLRQVAEDIGMHESTISRVVSNKYMDTPRGLFPMKFFFHSGVDSARGGAVSSLVVKEKIKKMIEAEDENKPLSDSKIMKMLQREGIRLARRTVAKYREEMKIASSDKRKNLF